MTLVLIGAGWARLGLALQPHVCRWLWLTSISPPFTQPRHHWHRDLESSRGWSDLKCCRPNYDVQVDNNNLITRHSSSICKLNFLLRLHNQYPCYNKLEIETEKNCGNWREIHETRKNFTCTESYIYEIFSKSSMLLGSML